MPIAAEANFLMMLVLACAPCVARGARAPGAGAPARSVEIIGLRMPIGAADQESSAPSVTLYIFPDARKRTRASWSSDAGRPCHDSRSSIARRRYQALHEAPAIRA